MQESRRVECKDPDCGYTWESTADDPRCPDPDSICGRSRAREVGDPDADADGDLDEGEESVPDTSEETDEERGLSFLTREVRTDAGGESQSPPSRDRGDTDDESDADADGDDSDEDDEEIELPELEAEDIRPMFEFAFGAQDGTENSADPVDGFLSRSRGAHWRMKDRELDQLSRAWARVGNKYAPYLLAEYSVEGMALITTAMIVMPRVQEDKRREELAEAQERDDRPPTETEETDGADAEIDEGISSLIGEGDESGEEPDIALNRV